MVYLTRLSTLLKITGFVDAFLVSVILNRLDLKEAMRVSSECHNESSMVIFA